MPLLTVRIFERARDAQDEAEVLRDRSLTLAYRAGVLREEAAALRAQAGQLRRHGARRREARPATAA
jgi:hypothetical protein